MSEALVQHQNGAIARSTSGGLAFTSEQRRMIRDMYANGASESEFGALIAIAEARGLNPLLKQVYFVKRWDSQKRAEVWAVQGSIDGLRAIAQRTGLYDGQDEPEFEYDAKGKLTLARVKVYRKDWGRPAVGVARWDEYAQKKKDGGLTQFWETKGHIMLAKCAEAIGLRKAFPEDMGGIYVPEEMGDQKRADAAREVNPRPAPVRGVVRDDDASPPPPAIAAQIDAQEPMHDEATGEIVEPESTLGTEADHHRMLHELRAGFPDWNAKRAWRDANKLAKDAQPTERQLVLSTAFIAASPNGAKESK